MDVTDLKYIINVSNGKIANYNLDDFESVNQTGLLQVMIENVDKAAANFYVSVIFEGNLVKSVEEKK